MSLRKPILPTAILCLLACLAGLTQDAQAAPPQKAAARTPIPPFRLREVVQVAQASPAAASPIPPFRLRHDDEEAVAVTPVPTGSVAEQQPSMPAKTPPIAAVAQAIPPFRLRHDDEEVSVTPAPIGEQPSVPAKTPPAVVAEAIPPFRLLDGRTAEEVAVEKPKPPVVAEKTPTTPTPPALQKNPLEFDLGATLPPVAAPLPLAESLRIERMVKKRRSLLLAHQAFGFITLAALAATMVIGQLDYLDNFGSNPAYTGRYTTPHLGLGIVTTGLFATTGILALAAPNPYPKPYRLDSAMVHRVSMALATVGMVAQIILGPITQLRDGKLDQSTLATAHLATGYATFAFMATGVFAYVF